MCWICWVPEEAAPISENKSLSLWPHHSAHVRMCIVHVSVYIGAIFINRHHGESGSP